MIVIVVGMHRSGTSALAGALHAGGVSMGEDPHFFPRPTRENPRGFWEDFRFREINDDILEASGYTVKTFDPRIPRVADRPSLAHRRRALLRRRAREAPVWGWKDPRTCLTLGLWLESLDREGLREGVRPVLVHRSPESVARSLAVRNGLPLEQGFRLWTQYNRRVMRALRSGEVGFLTISFEGLLERPDKELGRLAGFSGVELEMGAARRFLDPGLDRSSHPVPGPALPDSPAVRRAGLLEEVLQAHQS